MSIYWQIEKAEYVKNYKIKIYFANGTNGIANFEKFSERTDIFKAFNDIEYFKQFKVINETLCWPGAVDIAPETLYMMVHTPIFSR